MKQVRMGQRQHDCSVSTHRESGNRPPGCIDMEPAFDVRSKIVDDEVFVPGIGLARRIDIPGVGGIRHDDDDAQPWPVRRQVCQFKPVAMVSAIAMQQIKNGIEVQGVIAFREEIGKVFGRRDAMGVEAIDCGSGLSRQAPA